ncbi:adenylyltransferase/cytidyltransferase family protein [Candidatus Micrarchaeota archaeon]|nr:adenylyltransferase/cytidyltransferase family protein [Candidatus Micrarchaeota archaeon]
MEKRKKTGRRTSAKAKRLRLLFPGRFQPFHNAHFLLLKKQLLRFDVIVVIGSADVKDEDNPFSSSERKKMIQACFPKKKLKFGAVPYAPDKTWVKTLLKAVPRRSFDLVFSNNPRVQKQLHLHAIPVIGSPLVRRNRLEGKRIRQWPKSWKKDVPKPVAAWIRRHRTGVRHRQNLLSAHGHHPGYMMTHSQA